MQILLEIRVDSATGNETYIHTRGPESTDIANLMNKSRDTLRLNGPMFGQVAKARADQRLRDIGQLVASNSLAIQKAPPPRVAENTSSSAGIYTTPTSGPCSSLTPIDTLQLGSAYRKLVVPSIGSMHHV